MDVPPEAQFNLQDLEEIIRLLANKQNQGKPPVIHEGVSTPTSPPNSTSSPDAFGIPDTSPSIFGKVTTHRIGATQVRYIEGITTLEPTQQAQMQHQQLLRQLNQQDQEKFRKAQQSARQRILTLGKLVNGAARFVLLDDVFKFWLTPSNAKTIARASYAEDGRAYPSIDTDDIQNNDERTVTHYLGHEFVHILSLHQTYESTGKTESGLKYEITVFQVGLCFRQKSTFTVNNIKKEHWDEWARNILHIDQEFAAGKRSVKLDGISPTALQMIHIFKEKFGSTWLDQAKATLKTKGEELYKIQTWTADVELVTGEELNETLTEFLARILSCQNMLSPSNDEIEWFKNTRIYGNLDGINQLMKVYNTISNDVDKIAYLGALIKTLQSADLTYMIDAIAKYDSTASPSKALTGEVAPQHAKNADNPDLIDLLEGLLRRIL